ncbi:peptide ABC transporter substrate-binding protein [Listeria booriae]|uniref:Peptide ABC transporter substrate-binding protein n=2 Tax=Listeria booriae TaxID=1552123 RepID=A0A7X0ZW45_9LIST|nr:peptide ABC transporter substrate-binding protein [Listeria booriae]MBC1889844.1 peptide ABC transporter substrate-binding protein [Listeria booriae]MBC2003567.1 peptide ABC transporter substrate-binding protein [Listeria booriae]MBC2020500.1 peptide ABC transporter substrate-binding protein [Listeria booriae]MBC2049092.1 peptide ABC transporter substrate-binding protein [Listeria booriae]MBC2079812.1 peptide ABC transporter substrate-binding protein [Listeria booriae]
MKLKKSWVLALVLSVMAAVLVACGGGGDTSKDSVNKSSKKEVSLMESAEIPSMDSKKGTDGVSFTAQNTVFEGLYYLDKDDKVQPGVAKADPEVNAEQTVYTIKLRDDAKWSNGTPVTANDFVYSWRKIVDPKTAAEYAVIFSGVVKNATQITAGEMKPEELGVKAIDDTTLEVTLEQPVPYFHSLLTFPTFYPQNEEYVEKQGTDYAKDSDHMIYNGAFTMKGWTNTSKSWSYEKNDKYWNKGDIKLDKINLEVIKDPGSAVNLYTTGKLDRATLSGDYAKQKQNDKDFTSNLDAFVYFLKFNQKLDGKQTIFANENVRKAIATVINKETMVDTVLANGSQPIDGLVPAKFTFNPKTQEDFRKESGDLITYDKAKAQEYWKKAKQELGQDNITIEFLGDDQEFSKKMSEYIQNELETSLDGLKVNIKTVPYKSRLKLDETQQYELQLSRWGPDYQDPSTFLGVFETTSSYNRSSYSNPEYDKLLKEAATTLATQPEARWNNLLKAEKILISDDTAIAPLYQNGVAALQNPKMSGFVSHLFGAPYSYQWITIK